MHEIFFQTLKLEYFIDFKIFINTLRIKVNFNLKKLGDVETKLHTSHSCYSERVLSPYG